MISIVFGRPFVDGPAEFLYNRLGYSARPAALSINQLSQPCES